MRSTRTRSRGHGSDASEYDYGPWKFDGTPGAAGATWEYRPGDGTTARIRLDGYDVAVCDDAEMTEFGDGDSLDVKCDTLDEAKRLAQEYSDNWSDENGIARQKLSFTTGDRNADDPRVNFTQVQIAGTEDDGDVLGSDWFIRPMYDMRVDDGHGHVTHIPSDVNLSRKRWNLERIGSDATNEMNELDQELAGYDGDFL